jgi:hypothetical protein
LIGHASQERRFDVNLDLGKLTDVAARHGLKVSV